MPLSQALTYSLTASPPSTSPIILLPLYLTSPTVLTRARYPSFYISHYTLVVLTFLS